MPSDTKFELQQVHVLQRAGHLEAAIELCHEILNRRPADSDALWLAAVLQAQAQNWEVAIHLFTQVVKHRPAFVEGHYNLACALTISGRDDAALRHYERTLKLAPGHVQALLNGANTLMRLGRHTKALELLDRLLVHSPHNAQALSNRSAVLSSLDRFAEALETAEKAIAVQPSHAEAHYNRGVALQKLGRLDEALASYETAISLNTSSAPALNNRGLVLHDLTRFDEAIASYERALALQPDYADAHGNCYQTRLLTGDFAKGWPQSEWRKKKSQPVGSRPYRQPLWLGQAELAGKTILVHAEQGLGDTIQFCRYLPLLEEHGARVLFRPQKPLLKLMASLPGSIELIEDDRKAAFDFHAPLLSLPVALGTELESIPASVPYLSADPARVARWRAHIGAQGVRVGIAWQGSAMGHDLGKSIPLAAFEPLSRIQGVRLISLQKNDGTEQLASAPPGMVETLGSTFDAGPGAFLDTAAVMECLDLIISIDTSIVHLAGALRRPAWVLLKQVPDWRWLMQRADTPWYPSLRLFRQRARNDWSAVLREVERQLSELSSTRSAPNERPS